MTNEEIIPPNYEPVPKQSKVKRNTKKKALTESQT
jgi:hypothetical protein